MFLSRKLSDNFLFSYECRFGYPHLVLLNIGIFTARTQNFRKYEDSNSQY